MSYIISTEEAAARLEQPQTVFLDAQFEFGSPEKGYALYEAHHIPGAAYFHLDEDLSGPIETHGGRHPLPDADAFIAKLRNAGVSNDSHVIVYDNTGGATAGRLWWMLHYLGHQHVQLLSQPLSQWIAKGYPVSSSREKHAQSDFTPSVQTHFTVDYEDVLANLDNEQRVLLDARVPNVYTGEKKTKYKLTGHIPGAHNLFWEELLNDELEIRPDQELITLLADIPADQEVVVYCGAGVTACADIVALKQIGYPNVKLYVGSWGDWSSHEESPTEGLERHR